MSLAKALRQVFQAAALGAGLAVIYHLLYRFVLLPVSEIERAMQRRATGDASAYAPVRAPDEIGHVAHTFNRMVDIVAEREGRLQRVIDGSHLGYWDWEVWTGVVTFGGRWAEMLGFTLEEIGPSMQTWQQLLHPQDRPHAQQALARAVEGETE